MIVKAVVIAAMSSGVAQLDQELTVSVRGQAVQFEGVVASVGREGLVLDTGSGPTVVPWTRVEMIESSEDLPEQVESLWRVGRDVHRAMRRLERGDLSGAEPLFARHFRDDAEAVSSMDLVCADGLMRCRIDRGAMAQAVLPMLQTTRALRSGATSDWPPIVDVDRAWCPWIAPVWTDADAATRCGVLLDRWDAGGDPVLEQARSDWSALADGRPVETAEFKGASMPGLATMAMFGDADARGRVVDMVGRWRSAEDPAEQAWRDWVLGSALLRESGTGRRREALAVLARIPALHGQSHPYLAGVALAVMACELDRDGRDGSAESLMAELESRWPRHPILKTPREHCLSTSGQASVKEAP